MDSSSRFGFSEEESLVRSLLKKSILSAKNSNEDGWHSDNVTKFDSFKVQNDLNKIYEAICMFDVFP